MTMAIVDLQVASECQQLPSAKQFKRWVEAALQKEMQSKDEIELAIRIVDEADSQALNMQYRGKEKPTNVLSFPFEAPPQVPCDLLGDLVICHAIVIDEAKEQGKFLGDHWAHMLIHGCLHLLGFDHVQDDEAEAMEILEIDILKKLEIDNPYQSI